MFKILIETYGGGKPAVYEVESAELHALREWFCTTKPLAASTKLTSDGASIGMDFGIVATGDSATERDLAHKTIRPRTPRALVE